MIGRRDDRANEMTGPASARDLAPAVIRRTIELAETPAPTGAEQSRADLVLRWWAEDGWAPYTDTAGNVWARVADGPGPGLLVCAHLDTVFPADLPHVVAAKPGRLCGPSVGDNSIGVAALSAVAKLLRPVAGLGPDAGPGPDAGAGLGPDASAGPGPVWLVATVGEEGTGNLAGIRHALAHPPAPVSAVIAVEGNYLGRVVTTGVGSVRWRVRYAGPGGHAWERAEAPSAVHAAAGGAARLAALVGRAPAGARCTVNVGLIGGGPGCLVRCRPARRRQQSAAAPGEAGQGDRVRGPAGDLRQGRGARPPPRGERRPREPDRPGRGRRIAAGGPSRRVQCGQHRRQRRT